ncbi:hypothetical protein PR202_ga23186 [Eleusine coracana subsp. coracana]|uniref:Pollen-specific protein SF21 n=1 Tax=Eleusine coracana subsp. coracana TaxID=191504 RepID=A0AAV5D3L8_ELECO|nr:hypothetical protein PR202_ga23186 [Eleusine coracana subsp. coracana]
MGDSSGSVSIDVERLFFGGKEHRVQTRCGILSVSVYGDEDKPALITYPDVALNYMSCFQGLFFCPEAASLLLHNFCVYHITPQGHELGAAPIPSDVPVPSVDDLADQVADVLDFFSLGSVMCLGVTAGAYILTLFAEVRGNGQDPESEIVQACRSLLHERQGANVWRFLQAINKRHDLTDALKKLQCRTLIFVGEYSQFHVDAVHMTTKLDQRYCALVEVQACGSLVTEEQPHAMLIPMEYFLMGYGLYRPSQHESSPRSTLSPFCISPELLSPESMGVKLKPIKTRISLNA